MWLFEGRPGGPTWSAVRKDRWRGPSAASTASVASPFVSLVFAASEDGAKLGFLVGFLVGLADRRSLPLPLPLPLPLSLLLTAPAPVGRNWPEPFAGAPVGVYNARARVRSEHVQLYFEKCTRASRGPVVAKGMLTLAIDTLSGRSEHRGAWVEDRGGSGPGGGVWGAPTDATGSQEGLAAVMGGIYLDLDAI